MFDVKRTIFLLVVMLIFMSTMTAGATSLPISLATVELNGENFMAESSYDADTAGTLRAVILNSSKSSEDIEYFIYRDSVLIAEGRVKAGQAKKEYIQVEDPGSYHIKIQCHIPPNVRYSAPPCVGVGNVNWS
jgi:hypothetical protein